MTSTRVLMPTERVVFTALAIGRWAAWVWMTGVVAFSDDGLRRPWLAILMCIIGGVFASIATVAVRARHHWLFSPALLVAESVYAVALHVVDGAVYDPGHVFAVSQNLAVEWPLLVVLTLAFAAGPLRAATFGLIAGLAKFGGAHLNEFDDYSTKHFVSVASTCVQLVIVGIVGGRLAVLLRRVETEEVARKAKDEVARTLHDTVLQTLAVVDRRVGASDPELAAMARQADRDLRHYLFATTSDTVGVDDGIRAAASAAQQRFDPSAQVEVVVNLLTDGLSLGSAHCDAIVGATGEAIANALEHAAPRRVVVFAEADDDGHVFVSVRDDGCGFDRAAPSAGRGIVGSIEGRLADVGGRAEVVSSPGHGTEVRLWTHP